MVPQCTVCSTLARKILASSAQCIKVCHRCWVSERQRRRSQAPIASIASVASVPRIPSVRRKDFRQVITDIGDIRVTSETFEARIDGRVSLTWDIAQLIMTCLKSWKKSLERCLLRSCANVLCLPLLQPCYNDVIMMLWWCYMSIHVIYVVQVSILGTNWKPDLQDLPLWDRVDTYHHVAVLCLAMYPCFCAPKLHKIISRFTRRVFHGFLKDPKDLESVYKY